MSRSFILLTILFVSVFVAGVVDITFPDVEPIRPYTSFFVTASIQNVANQASSAISIPIMFVLVVVSLLALSVIFHIPMFGIFLTGKAALHPNARHTADCHRDYAPLRNMTQGEQINKPVEKYADEKRKAFEKKFPKKKKRIIGLEFLWQD